MEEHLLLLAIAVFSAVGGLAFITLPGLLQETFIGTLAPSHWEEVWAVDWALGGWLVMLGMWRLSPRVEAAGLCLLAGAFATNVVAVLDLRGAAGAISAWINTGLATGCLLRAFARGRVLER